MAKDKVKKKPQRFNLPMSRTNYNRLKASTHSLVRVLFLEGYEVRGNYVVSEGSKMHLDAIDPWPRKKRGEDAQARNVDG